MSHLQIEGLSTFSASFGDLSQYLLLVGWDGKNFGVMCLRMGL